MSAIEAKSGGQQTPFRIAGGAEDDAVSAVYEKRRSQVHHWQYIKESGYSANINIGQRGNTPAVGSRQANLPWRLQKGSCLKKPEVSNLI